MDETDPASWRPKLASSENGSSGPVGSGAHSNPANSTGSKPPAPWASQTTTFSASSSGSPGFPQFSATTAEILKRLQASNSNATGTPAFEAKRAEVLQSYVTSDKLPTPPPVANSNRRGRGGRIATPKMVNSAAGSTNSTPASGRGRGSGRGSGRGRGRGSGRGGGRGGKRKRAESVESDDDSDISSSYTPLPTRTKSGRNVTKPVAFVPVIPEPTQAVKRRRSTKTILAAQCKTCHRGTDPGNNRIVFCDVCTTAYHQYCHDPPIDNEVVTVLEKEWICGPCARSKDNVVEGTDELVAAPEGFSADDKRAYLSTLSQEHLISLLLHATIRHPELPIFPQNVHNLISNSTKTASSNLTTTSSSLKPQPNPQSTLPVTSPAAGHASSAGGTPHSNNNPTITSTSSELDSAEAQLLSEIQNSHQPPALTPKPTTSAAVPSAATNNGITDQQQQIDEYDDGYDTDPPAHYPKAGNGLARTMRPESEDLQWLVDDNFEVFSHGWKGDGSGVGGDGTLNGL
ncbi:hypothetical protein DM02DRAFT_608902 [Periconia macrospinosa]|uniref:PHD-type domain-containing protein n=1 Tax=Periconia macrospinosa TaxID=97972 RepID=A0A2V1ECG0_9PLEO|nr:hypothetical protein DM02DRAFT_608902 [Periconia macrospinosa]